MPPSHLDVQSPHIEHCAFVPPVYVIKSYSNTQSMECGTTKEEFLGAYTIGISGILVIDILRSLDLTYLHDPKL